MVLFHFRLAVQHFKRKSAKKLLDKNIAKVFNSPWVKQGA